jgi:fluoride ion exporter CrcB/FEX
MSEVEEEQTSQGIYHIEKANDVPNVSSDGGKNATGLTRRIRGGDNSQQHKRQRDFERASYILSESFQMLDSYKDKSGQNEEELALESNDRSSSQALQEDSKNRRHPRHHPSQEPFISSLLRSFQVVQRGQAWINEHRDTDGTFFVVQTALHIAAYAVLGALFRIFLVQLFGSTTCHSNHDDSSESGTSSPQYLIDIQQTANLCIATDGQFDNAVFANLPANLLGCFLMGLFQASTDLGLAKYVPIASLPEHHFFQDLKLHHVGLRTGFCGSLTTLASWNSQLVRLADGFAFPGSGGSQFAVAVMACMLGLQGAVVSFRTGQDVAIWIFRYCHPHWAREEDLLAFAFSKNNSDYRNNEMQNDDNHRLRRTPLTDYERNFLAFLIPQQEFQFAEQNVAALEDLEKWKVSTDQVRLQAARIPTTATGGDEDLIAVLHSIERQILLDHTYHIPDKWQKVVEENGWDTAALQRFAAQTGSKPVKATKSLSRDGLSCMQKMVSTIPFVLALSLLLIFVTLDYTNVNRQYYRKMWATALLAPLGAVLRWKLTSWNGRLRGNSWMWFPLGTLVANWTACLVSSVLTAIEDSSQRFDTNIDETLSFALKAGFTGCLSTVSTYVAEGVSLQKMYPHHAKGK